MAGSTLAVAVALVLLVPLAPPWAPVVSCIDGHIVVKLSDCPPVLIHRNDQHAPVGGGGGGLLGGLLGGIL